MAEYIERYKAIEAVRSDPMGGLNYKRILTDIPAADVAPVVHGRWKKKKDSDLFYCSECELPSMHKWQYCERCGAKMEGGDEHE